MTESQEQVWDNIAPDWYENRTRVRSGLTNFIEGKEGKILDLGSGAGRILINLKTKGAMYLVDFSKEMIALAKKRAEEQKIKAHFKIADSTKIPYENNFFDYAVCLAVLHCMNKKDGEKTLKELYRVLKPKSESLITVWNKDSKWFKNRAKETQMKWTNKGLRYLYLYEPQEFYDLIEKTGFKIIKKFTPERNIVVTVQKP